MKSCSNANVNRDLHVNLAVDQSRIHIQLLAERFVHLHHQHQIVTATPSQSFNWYRLGYVFFNDSVGICLKHNQLINPNFVPIKNCPTNFPVNPPSVSHRCAQDGMMKTGQRNCSALLDVGLQLPPGGMMWKTHEIQIDPDSGCCESSVHSWQVFYSSHSAKMAIWKHVGLSKTGRYPEMAVLTGTWWSISLRICVLPNIFGQTHMLLVKSVNVH